MRLLFSLLLLMFSSLVIAEENPFEIKGRMLEVIVDETIEEINPFELVVVRKTKEIVNSLSESINPFDIIQVDKEELAEAQWKNSIHNTELELSNGKVYLGLLGLSVLFVLLFVSYKSIYIRNLESIKSSRIFHINYRGGGISVFNLGSFLYYFFFCLVLTFVINLYLDWLQFDFSPLLLFGLITVWFLLRHLFLLLLAFIFSFKQQLFAYNFMINVFNQFLGVLLLPLLILAVLLVNVYGVIVFYVIGVIVVLFLIFRFIRAILLEPNFILSNKFHFILYLCVLEISPIIIVVKLLLSK